MKELLFFIGLNFVSLLSYSQTYGFSYDQSGNRLTKAVSSGGGGSSGTSKREAIIPASEITNANSENTSLSAPILLKWDTTSVVQAQSSQEIIDFQKGYGVSVVANKHLAHLTLYLNEKVSQSTDGVVEILNEKAETTFSVLASNTQIMLDFSEKPKGKYKIKIKSGEYIKIWDLVIE